MISSAIHKYGKNNFKFEILDFAETQEQLNYKEKFWANYCNSYADTGWGYNIRECGGSKGHLSSETKEKISLRNSGHPKETHPWWGKHHTSETKEKISEHRKGKLVGKDNPMSGRPWYTNNTPEHKIQEWKDSHSLPGFLNPMYGKHHDGQTKEKMHKPHPSMMGAGNGRAINIICIETGRRYDCQKDAAMDIGCSNSAICDVVNGHKNSIHGYHFIKEEM